MEANISKGNSKLGSIPNVSLVPVKDCANCQFCKSTCYAMKAWRQYPQVRKAWRKNSTAVRGPQRASWFQSIDRYIAKRTPEYFRWHVAGDILDQHYYECVREMAKRHPDTKFLCFTKRYDLKLLHRPKNLAIVISIYPGMKKPKTRHPKAWMQDGTETRIPKDAIECSGSCSGCNACWDLQGKDVFFHKH